MLSKYGSILSQEEVGGRLISTFKLKQPIIYKTREIDCIELPSPKEGSFYEQGYEHAEFVIDEKFSQFINRHPTVNFSTRAISKKTNPDISIGYDGISVKFHHEALESVIKNQQ